MCSAIEEGSALALVNRLIKELGEEGVAPPKDVSKLDQFVATINKRLDKVAKDAKRGDKEAQAEQAVLSKLKPHLDAGKPALTCELTTEEK